MEVLKQWILSISAVSLIAAILGAITPNGTPSKIMKMCLAFLLVIVLISPIKKMDFDRFDLLTLEMESELNEKTESIALENEKISNDIIENALIEYICNQAEIKESDIEVYYEGNEIEKVVLYTKKAEVLKIIKEDLGVKREKIIIKEREE